MKTEPVVLVVGGASGIGGAAARDLRDHGWRVVDADYAYLHSREAEQEVDGIMRIGVDAADEATIKRLVEVLELRFGHLDALVYSPAPARTARKSFPENMETLEKELNVLLVGALQVCSNALPLLRAANGASVVLLGSVLGRHIAHESIGYHVSKAGLVNAARYLAVHLASDMIRVNVVSPGIVKREVAPGAVAPKADELFERLLQRAVPAARAAAYQEVSDLIRFLVSDHSLYITGQELVLDGGLTLQEPFNLVRRTAG